MVRRYVCQVYDVWKGPWSARRIFTFFPHPQMKTQVVLVFHKRKSNWNVLLPLPKGHF